MSKLWNCGRQPRRHMEQGRRTKRMAVLVGCNYPGTETQLLGCYNDVARMRTVLVGRFGFNPDSIELLTDDPHGGGGTSMPTGANIKDAVGRIVDRAEEGDVLYFQYSGHGFLIPASLDSNESSEDEEAIVPCDFNLITSKDIRELVNRLPFTASFTIFSDSCHSGGLINNEKEQIGPKSVKASTGSSNISRHLLPKRITLNLVLEKLKLGTRMNSSDIGHHLKAKFKREASLSFRVMEGEDSDASQPIKLDSAILLSGCQTNESSADVRVKDDGGGDGGCDGISYGAFSHAVQMVLKKHPGRLSNREVVMMAKKLLEEMGLNQHPCLYCSDDNSDAPFLWQPAAADNTCD